MKNIKDITISIFAIIGFVALVTGFTNEAEQQPTFATPESHVWEPEMSPTAGRAYLYHKVTGEVRKFAKTWPSVKGVDSRVEARSYIVTQEIDF